MELKYLSEHPRLSIFMYGQQFDINFFRVNIFKDRFPSILIFTKFCSLITMWKIDFIFFSKNFINFILLSGQYYNHVYKQIK